jgi:serine/threonine protein kinase
MNDIPSRPPAPPPSTDQVSDTASGALEVTGNLPADAPGATRRTVPGAPVPPAPEGDALPAIGGYTVVRKLGEGGMGVVYLAEDVKLNRKVAIKIMRPEFAGNKLDRDRFEREARAAARVEHDNIVPVLHVGEAADGTPFIVMPFLRGEALDARLKRDPAASLGFVLKVAREAADGLAAAHAQDLIHRDIKPGNIWLEGDPTSTDPAQQIRRCKILDFGLARSVNRDDAQVTASGAILGTPAYMAPEQARGEKADHRADLFSLGVTLYRAATGRLPFDGPTPMAVLIALTTETQISVSVLAPHLPQALADLIDRLMCKAPSGRPQSAAEVSAAVRQIVQELKAKHASALPTVRASAPPPVPQDLIAGAEPAEASSSRPVELTDDELTESEPEAPPHGAPRGRLRWIVAAVVGVFVLVSLGWWIVDPFGSREPADAAKNEAPPGNSDPLKQTAPPKDVPTNFAAERKAAEFVVACGGRLRIDDRDKDYQKGKDLPTDPFRLRWADFRGSTRVTDGALAVFEQCQHLEKLDLSGTATGDAGLAHFRGCKQLAKLELRGTSVGDAGLETIKQFKRLRNLELQKTQVSKKGVTDLAKVLPECMIEWDGGHIDPWAGPDRAAAEYVLSFPKSSVGVSVNNDYREITAGGELPKEPFALTRVRFDENTPVTDEGLAVFKKCRDLLALNLTDTPVGDAGLAHFAGCKGLTFLYLHNTKVGGKGLAALEECTGVKDLSLSYTQVTDADLVHIKPFTKLESLQLSGLKLSAESVTELAKALPKCRIVWAGGTIGPMVSPDADRKAAEWVLSAPNAEGSVSIRVNGQMKDVKAANDLPKEPFELTAVNLIPKLVDMKLVGPKDADLAVFKNCKNITLLYLSGTGITNAGLAHFGNCKDLEGLYLSGTKVDDKAVGVIKQFTKLADLSIGRTDFQEKGVREIAGALPQCQITWDGGTIGPKK